MSITTLIEVQIEELKNRVKRLKKNAPLNKEVQEALDIIDNFSEVVLELTKDRKE